MNLKTTSLVIKEVTEEKEILSILTDEEIYERITDDACPKREDYRFNSIGATFYGGYLKGKLIGLIIHHDGWIHVNILKDYRKYKSEFWHGVRKNLIPPFKAKIPTLFPSIIEFAESEGFVLQEVIKDGGTKNGETYDMCVMVNYGLH